MATILVVDDEQEIADLVEIYLNNDGFDVIKAYDGEECLEKLKEHPEIRVIILDVMMPKMDGMETCRRIRRTSNIPIIMLSAKTADMDKILGFGTGVDDYVTKPFNPLELTARVKSQLKRYQAIQGVSASPDMITVRDLEINNTVMVHIRRLREKIEDDPKNPSLIKTVWGVGYKIEA